MQHQLDAYKDGFIWVPYCKICGDENPTGDCLGKFVPHSERNVPEKGVDKLVDNKPKCE